MKSFMWSCAAAYSALMVIAMVAASVAGLGCGIFYPDSRWVVAGVAAVPAGLLFFRLFESCMDRT